MIEALEEVLDLLNYLDEGRRQGRIRWLRWKLLRLATKAIGVGILTRKLD